MNPSRSVFAYHAALATGQNFTISGVYYTEWTKQLGIAGLGRPVDVVTTITASTGTTAGFQSYINGAIYTITSGTFRNLTVSVLLPIYGLYGSSGGPTGRATTRRDVGPRAGTPRRHSMEPRWIGLRFSLAAGFSLYHLLMSPIDFLDHLKKSSEYRGQLAECRRFPARAPRFGALERPLAPVHPLDDIAF